MRFGVGGEPSPVQGDDRAEDSIHHRVAGVVCAALCAQCASNALSRCAPPDAAHRHGATGCGALTGAGPTLADTTKNPQISGRSYI
jgi:hypothetical protein